MVNLDGGLENPQNRREAFKTILGAGVAAAGLGAEEMPAHAAESSDERKERFEKAEKVQSIILQAVSDVGIMLKDYLESPLSNDAFLNEHLAYLKTTSEKGNSWSSRSFASDVLRGLERKVTMVILGQLSDSEVAERGEKALTIIYSARKKIEDLSWDEPTPTKRSKALNKILGGEDE